MSRLNLDYLTAAVGDSKQGGLGGDPSTKGAPEK